jgi:septum formation topological specificity factor MinE
MLSLILEKKYVELGPDEINVELGRSEKYGEFGSDEKS